MRVRIGHRDPRSLKCYQIIERAECFRQRHIELSLAAILKSKTGVATSPFSDPPLKRPRIDGVHCDGNFRLTALKEQVDLTPQGSEVGAMKMVSSTRLLMVGE